MSETTSELNSWAAKFLGEDDEDVEFAGTAEWYTSSPGSAFVVVTKALSEGKRVEIIASAEGVVVKVGDATRRGSLMELANILVEACYAAYDT